MVPILSVPTHHDVSSWTRQQSTPRQRCHKDTLRSIQNKRNKMIPIPSVPTNHDVSSWTCQKLMPWWQSLLSSKQTRQQQVIEQEAFNDRLNALRIALKKQLSSPASSPMSPAMTTTRKNKAMTAAKSKDSAKPAAPAAAVAPTAAAAVVTTAEMAADGSSSRRIEVDSSGIKKDSSSCKLHSQYKSKQWHSQCKHAWLIGRKSRPWYDFSSNRWYRFGC